MSFWRVQNHLAHMMGGYDIPDDEFDRLMRESWEKAEREEAERLSELAWEKQHEEECHEEERQQWEIETYGHTLPKFVVGMPYREYLDTQRWRAIAEWIKYRDSWRCRVCQQTKKLHVHHRTYTHIYQESGHDDDLVTLCETCHRQHHAGIINIEKLLTLPKIEEPT